MTNFDRYQRQFDLCCGPPGQFVKPKPLTGIEREKLAELQAIADEWKKVQEAGR